MRKGLSLLVLGMGIWSIIAAIIDFLVKGSFGAPAWVVAICGIILLILGAVGMNQKTSCFKGGDMFALVIGIIMLLAGIIMSFATPGFPVSCASMIVVGLFTCVLSWIMAHLPSGEEQTKVVNLQGQEMVAIKQMVANDKHGIGAKAILMGAMPQTVYFDHGQLYNLLAQIDFDCLKGIVKELVTAPEKKQQ